jgi:hypothetical protein
VLRKKYGKFVQKVSIMSALQIENTDRYLKTTLDKETFDEAQIMDLLDYLCTENSVKKAQFDDSILELSKSIKKSWWSKHKDTLLK